MSDFAEAITYLSADDPSGRISAIKQLVVDHLRTTDSRIDISVTDHFNHSWVPDFVLRWPDSSEEREVYLRTSFRSWDLLEDLDALRDERSILMPLAPISHTEEDADRELENKSKERRTLIADPYSLEAFDREQAHVPVVSLLSHAMLQGGRGLLSSDRALSISEAVGAGFSAAQVADYDATNVAVQAAESVLDSQRASQINRLLHAVWVGSGAPATSFPGATGVTTSLDAEGLRFILEMPEFDDPTFWRRLGLGLTIERLCQLGDLDAIPNLQKLVLSAVHRLQAKACRVVTVNAGVDRSQWEIRSNTLTLRTPLHRVHFAPSYINQLPDNVLVDGPIPVAELRRRAGFLDANLGEVKLSNGDSTVSYGSEERPDVSRDTALEAVEQVVEGAAVVSATAHLGGGRTVRCNFATGTGSGNSSARYFVTELAAVAVPLLARMPVEEIEDIRGQTRPEGNVPDEPENSLDIESNSTNNSSSDESSR